MTTNRLIAVFVFAVLSQASELWARPPFPVTPLNAPYRPAATVEDFNALRFNPAGLGREEVVELAYMHRYARQGPGGDNVLALRLKTLAASVSWLEDAVLGARREYMIGLGHKISSKFTVGTTFRYIKADDSALQNTRTWTHSFQYTPGALLTFGARWENPWHAEISDQPTNGEIVAAVAVWPMGRRLTVSADWHYPEEAEIKDTRLVIAAYVHASPGVDAAAYFDTDNRFGIELRFPLDRAAVGGEFHFSDPGGHDYGTLYASLLNRSYENSKQDALPAGMVR